MCVFQMSIMLSYLSLGNNQTATSGTDVSMGITNTTSIGQVPSTSSGNPGPL